MAISTIKSTPTVQPTFRSFFTRQRILGIVFLLIAFGMWYVFAQGLGGIAESKEVEISEVITTFKLPLSSKPGDLFDWELSSSTVLNVLAIAAAFLGGVQLWRGFGRWANVVLAVVIGLFIFGFLTWGAAGKSLNLGGLLSATLVRAVPITLGAMSGILSERAGIVNIAIEGMMLTGALVGVFVGSIAKLWLPNSFFAGIFEEQGLVILGLIIGLAGAVFAGMLLSSVHAVLSIRYKINQIVSGTVINIFAVGFTSYLSARFLQKYQEFNSPGTFRPFEIPVLSEIPVLGPIFFRHNIFVYSMFIIIIVLHVALYYTRWGLRLRSVGEHPKAADTLGINVIRTRWMAVLLSGAMAGFAGGYFTLGSVPRFDEGLTAGRGFIGLAAMIFGNWNPIGSFGASLLFGFTDALQTKLAILKLPIPSEFLLMIPYLATMIILAGVVGKGQMPAADGQPYDKE
ncbi:MAG: ABC transporter permease [Anaerolineae bacterium]